MIDPQWLLLLYTDSGRSVYCYRRKKRERYRQRAPVRAITAVVVDVADGCCLWLLCARGGDEEKL